MLLLYLIQIVQIEYLRRPLNKIIQCPLNIAPQLPLITLNLLTILLKFPGHIVSSLPFLHPLTLSGTLKSTTILNILISFIAQPRSIYLHVLLLIPTKKGIWILRAVQLRVGSQGLFRRVRKRAELALEGVFLVG